MADRLTHLDISAFSLSGSWLNNLISTDVSFAQQLVDGMTVPMRYERGVVVAQRNTLRASLARGTAPSWKTNLDVSAFTIGGNDLIANLKRGTLSVTTDFEDGKGIADLHSFPNSLHTRISLEGELLYTGTTDRALFLLMDDAVSARSASCTVTVAGESLAGPFVFEDLTFTGSQGAIQRYRARMRFEGTLATNGGLTAVPTHSLLASILTGSAVVALQIKTSAAAGVGFDVTSNALVTNARVPFEDGAIIRDEFEFELQGAPTIANA